jgi:hypothetical protein
MKLPQSCHRVGEAELTEAVRRPLEDPGSGEVHIRAARTIAARFTARRSAQSLLVLAGELDEPASNKREHVLAAVAADLGLRGGAVVCPLLRETPDPRRHAIPPGRSYYPGSRRAASGPSAERGRGTEARAQMSPSMRLERERHPGRIVVAAVTAYL